jgi:hypothetical protein
VIGSPEEIGYAILADQLTGPQMETVVFGKWRLECDPEATRQAYHRISVGSPEACGCRKCQNFAVARSHVYPPAVLSLFRQLGINSQHEAEIYHMGRLGTGEHLYGGWFHFVGAIISEGDTIGPFDMEQGDHVPFRLFFANSSGLLEESFVGQPVVQLEFVAHVPWLLGSSEPN